MNTTHTPGPWHIANGVQIRSERHQIAKIWMMRSGEGNANAQLISAAPKLLEALQELVEIVDDAIAQRSAKDLDSFTLQPAREAVAQATGSSA